MAPTYGIHKALEELWMTINTNHVYYLYEEQSLTKIKYRNLLQSYIEEFLSLVPQHDKFVFQETEDILRKTIKANKDFNSVKAANAWMAIATYANNLFSQPWRKEYHEIRMFCGYYKHRVEAGLIGSEKMLEIMGYRRSANNTMILETPIDQERVCAVSRDAHFALVECQILCSIYQEVSKKIPSCTWLDVLHYRKTHVGTVEQCIQGLLYMFCRSMDCRTSHPCNEYFPSPPNQHCSCCTACHTTMSCSAPRCKYTSVKNGYHSLPNSLVGNSSLFVHGKQQTSSSSRARSGVPTGKLIDVDVPDSFHSNHKMELKPRGQARIQKRVERSYSSSDYSDVSPIYESAAKTEEGTDESMNKDSWESWNYVFRDLKLRDDDNKDIKSENLKKERSLSSSSAKLMSNISESNKRKGDAEIFKLSRSSDDVFDIARNEYKEKWECAACTYHNVSSRAICEMCGKSRNVGNECKPLVSGGKQCPYCTLVNEKSASICEACDHSLKGSPTYI